MTMESDGVAMNGGNLRKALPVVILGAGGHAKVLLDCLRCAGRTVLGATAPDTTAGQWCGVPMLGGDEAILNYAPDTVELVNGLGTIAADARRSRLYDTWKQRGYRFAAVVHPSAIVAGDVSVAEGAQIMAGVVLQPGCSIGENAIVNTRASVDHDSQVGAHVHIAPGCVLSGGVHIGEGAHLGTGCVVIQGIRIGKNALVAAGAVVVRDINNSERVRGVPAMSW